MRSLSLLLVVGLLSAIPPARAAEPAARRPNVVVILVDDMGG